MAERPEDLNLPNAVVTRIIKEALPAGVNVGRDARLAISKAASVFVLYATSCANNNALRSKRKTITVNDVFTALEDMEFDSFIEPLRTELEGHKKSQVTKKSKKAKLSVSKEAIGTEAELRNREAGDGLEEREEEEATEQETPAGDQEDGQTDEQVDRQADGLTEDSAESRMDTSS